MVLDAVSLRNPRAAYGFGESLARLSSSSDYAIRNMSRKIGQRAGHETPAQSTPPRSLPADYRISLPPTGFGIYLPSREPSATASLPDPVSPVEVIGAVEREIEIVAGQAGLPEQNVMYRAARLATQIAAEGQLLQRYEDELRERLSSVGLRLTFNRPRVGPARRALFRVVAELTDAGELGPDELRRLESVLRFYDPTMLLTQPTRRPQEVPPMPGDDWSVRRSDDWLNGTEESLDLATGQTADGRIVLAEKTLLKNLDWNVPTEERRSVVRFSRYPNGEPGNEPVLLRLVGKLYDEYATLISDERHLIVRHGAFMRYLSPGEKWLALNPTVARRLGWSTSGEGMFAWKDETGRTAVESIWWQDSNPNHSPPELRSEVGEGWLVLATKRALSQITRTYGPMTRSVFVTRERNEEREGTLTAAAEREIELSSGSQ